ncbi:MAG: hypothetical protein LQ352_000924 [Teloschistes flavicans]|nr:MAG: hypothetical protein LQ352_000924 [Teloschistes flavicans]
MADVPCCTCARLLSKILPQYDEKTEKQVAQDRHLGCCPFCQVSSDPTPLPQGLRDPPAYSPPSSPRPAHATLAYPPDGEDPPAYSASKNQEDNDKGEQTIDELARDVLHFISPAQDTISSLALRYAVPPNALRKKNNLYADHLIAARRAILIPGEFYKGGVSLSPQPIDGEEEELRKSKIRRWMVTCKVSDYNIALLYYADDPYKCDALLTRGHWLDPPTEPYLLHPFEKWQPPGCLMHEYTGKDIRSCLDRRVVLYVGDSTARQLFWATAKKLNATAADEEMREAGKHEDLTFEEDGVMVDFIWDPFLNSSSLRQELLSRADLRAYEHDEADRPAGLITIGAGLWHARHFESDWLDRFRSSVDGVASLLNVKDRVDPATPDPVESMIRTNALHAYLAPVQVPLYDVLSPSRSSTMTLDKINPMNEYLYNVSRNSGIKVAWSQLLMTRKNEFAYEESGLHVIESVASQRVDVILNMHCNAKLTLKQGKKSIRNLLSSELFRAFGTLIFVLVYCYIADRTQLLNKTQKYFRCPEFLAMSAIAATLGILSIRRSTADSSINAQPVAKQQGPDQLFLSRDQTDEWKGWMQFVILIYHYTGASRVLRIYQIIRVLVASYLFMTGFGHTLFFYRKQDYSTKRCASVLVGAIPFALSDCLFHHPTKLPSMAPQRAFLYLRLAREVFARDIHAAIPHLACSGHQGLA